MKLQHTNRSDADILFYFIKQKNKKIWKQNIVYTNYKNI